MASGSEASSLAVLKGEFGALGPREQALASLAATLTATPWAVTSDDIAEVRRQGFDDQQIEAVLAVIAMFNYLTRVADASGIDFDYQTPLPAFAPDRDQVSAPRPAPARAGTAGTVSRQEPRHDRLRAAWTSWRTYLLDSTEPLSRSDRVLLARVAAEESADAATVAALSSGGSAAGPAADDAGHVLAGFARKLSREPWQMRPADLDALRAAGYPETALLHAISVVAHQNADSRLSVGLAAARA